MLQIALRYCAIDEGEQMGPLLFDEVFSQYGTIFFEDSLAWTDGMDDWWLLTPLAAPDCLTITCVTVCRVQARDERDTRPDAVFRRASQRHPQGQACEPHGLS